MKWNHTWHFFGRLSTSFQSHINKRLPVSLVQRLYNVTASCHRPWILTQGMPNDYASWLLEFGTERWSIFHYSIGAGHFSRRYRMNWSLVTSANHRYQACCCFGPMQRKFIGRGSARHGVIYPTLHLPLVVLCVPFESIQQLRISLKKATVPPFYIPPPPKYLESIQVELKKRACVEKWPREMGPLDHTTSSHIPLRGWDVVHPVIESLSRSRPVGNISLLLVRFARRNFSIISPRPASRVRSRSISACSHSFMWWCRYLPGRKTWSLNPPPKAKGSLALSVSRLVPTGWHADLQV